MNAKEFLNQKNRFEEAARSLSLQIESCAQSIGNLTSADFSREFVTGSRDHDNSRDVKIMMILEDCSHQLKILNCRKSDYEKQVLDSLNRMDESYPKRALMQHHVLGHSQREIGRQWGYDHKQVQRFLQRGYEQFPMPDHPVEYPL